MRTSKQLVYVLLVAAEAAFAGSYDALLGPKIDGYLTGKGSPIAGKGSVFFSSGVQYNVDPRLIVAISGAESSFGTAWAACPSSGFNAWSWFYNGNCANSPFSSFAEGIQTVTHFMRKSYFDKGYTTIASIGSKYCAAGCSAWVPNVTTSYIAQNGDVSDLTFASGSTQSVEYTNRNTWQAASTGLTNIGFENIAPAGGVTRFNTASGLTLSGVTFVGKDLTAGQYLLAVVSAGVAYVNAWGSGDKLQGGVDELDVSLPPGVTAVGIDVMVTGSAFSGKNDSYVATLSTGEVFANIISSAPPTRSFVGFTSTTPISTIKLQCHGSFVMIDNFSFGSHR